MSFSLFAILRRFYMISTHFDSYHGRPMTEVVSFGAVIWRPTFALYPLHPADRYNLLNWHERSAKISSFGNGIRTPIPFSAAFKHPAFFRNSFQENSSNIVDSLNTSFSKKWGMFITQSYTAPLLGSRNLSANDVAFTAIRLWAFSKAVLCKNVFHFIFMLRQPSLT